MTAIILPFRKRRRHKVSDAFLANTWDKKHQVAHIAKIVVNLRARHWHRLNENQKYIVSVAEQLAMKDCVAATQYRALEDLLDRLDNESFIHRFRRWFCRDLRKAQ